MVMNAGTTTPHIVVRNDYRSYNEKNSMENKQCNGPRQGSLNSWGNNITEALQRLQDEAPNSNESRNSKKQTNTNEKNISQVHSGYFENKLITSGDVEKNPGPLKLLHRICILLLLVVILVIKIKEVRRDTHENQSIQQQSLNSISNLLNVKYRKLKKTPVEIKSIMSYISILLIIAGDVQPNPGPNNEMNTSTVECETCHQIYHLKIPPGNNMEKTSINKSFEWILYDA